MYLGFFAGWLGLWILFGRANLTQILSACAVVLAVHLFVYFYEEPTLRQKFGPVYSDFCHHVTRWLPRPRPWSQ
jgi:protein-S-isoprenylcysteine O-methyltransferase Ste14